MPHASDTTTTRARLEGLAAAVRLAWIPIVFALLVLLVGEAPRGRLVALAAAVMALGLGVTVHAGTILYGRSLAAEPTDGAAE